MADVMSMLDDVSWHGFASQGYTQTNENDFFGTSSTGSFKSNELGINASWQPLDQVNLSGQLLYKQMGNAKPKGVNVDFAIVDWRLIDDFDYGGGLRVGRLKNTFGFFNETRDVASTRPSILLPESTYIDYLRAAFHSSDSVGVYGRYELSRGTLSLDTVFGKPIFNDDTVDAMVGGDTDGDMENEEVFVARLSYEDGSGLWRTALSYSTIDADFETSDAEALIGFNDGEFNSLQYLFSLQFDWNQWQLIGEYQLRNFETKGILPDPTTFIPTDIKNEGFGHYVQLGYSFNSRYRAYIRRDTSYLDKDDKNGEKLSAKAFGTIPAHSAFAFDTTMGIIYTPSLDWTFGFELHRVNGTMWLPHIENPIAADRKQRWDMYLLQAAYRF